MSHSREAEVMCLYTIMDFIAFVIMRGQECYCIYVGGEELFTREQEETDNHPQL